MTPESVDPAVTYKSFVGSCMLFEAESIDIVRKLVEEDVYYKNDVVCVLSAALINIEILRYIISGTRTDWSFSQLHWQRACRLFRLEILHTSSNEIRNSTIDDNDLRSSKTVNVAILDFYFSWMIPPGYTKQDSDIHDCELIKTPVYISTTSIRPPSNWITLE